MGNLTGIKDAEYLAQFLGKKIIIRIGPTDPIKATYALYLYPSLESIHASGAVVVKDSEGRLFGYKWEQCENPYLILTDPRLEWEQK